MDELVTQGKVHSEDKNFGYRLARGVTCLYLKLKYFFGTLEKETQQLCCGIDEVIFWHMRLT